MAAKPKFSSTPASLIYAQSWPVPSSNAFPQRHPAKASSNSLKKGLNSAWICKPKQQITRLQKPVGPVHKSLSWASSMLSNNYPHSLEKDEHVMLDMADEFKITLQMFKKLTEQVKEVDEQLNSGRPYAFKHYFKDKSNSRTPRTKTRNYTPEIPMTNEAYQPCNNLGCKPLEQQQPAIQFALNRKTKKCSNSNFKMKSDTWSLANIELSNEQEEDERLGNESPSTCLQNGLGIGGNIKNINYNEEDIPWSSCLEFSDEDNHVGLGYIDPVPGDWQERKLEELELELCSEESGRDPLMMRCIQLRRLETETVEQEKKNCKIDENCENRPHLDSAVSKATLSNKGKKSANSKKLSLKVNEIEKTERNQQKILKKSSRSASSLHDLQKDCELKGMKLLKKENKDMRKDKKETRTQSNGKQNERKSARGRRRVQSCKARPIKSLVTYDILDLATSFDPPCIERIQLNPRPVTAKSARAKGMLPGKSWTSQRRRSLTAGQSLQSIPSDNSDPVISKSRTSSAKKPSKKSAKRCSSSKL